MSNTIWLLLPCTSGSLLVLHEGGGNRGICTCLSSADVSDKEFDIRKLITAGVPWKIQPRRWQAVELDCLQI